MPRAAYTSIFGTENRSLKLEIAPLRTENSASASTWRGPTRIKGPGKGHVRLHDG